ncbi:MAG: hypothetical protein ACK4WM_00770 [Thermoflexales bacterium]
MSDSLLTKLRSILLTEFTETELIALCRDLNINYHSLPGVGQFGKSRELVAVAAQRGMLRALCSRVRELRPDVWEAQAIAPALMAWELAQQQRGRSSRPRLLLVSSAMAALAVAGIGVVSQFPGRAPSNPSLSSQQDWPTPVPTAASDNTAVITMNPIPSLVPSLTPTATPVLLELMITVQPSPTSVSTTLPSQTPSALPTIAADEHPAIRTVLEINEQLVGFFKGQVPEGELRRYWAGAAWERVVNFGNVKLFRAVRMNRSQRAALEVSYRYIQPPRLLSSTQDAATVFAQEAWQYRNPLNDRQLCDVREYTYELVKENDRWFIRAFRSEVLEEPCLAR